MDSYLQEGREIDRLRRQAGIDPVTGAAAVRRWPTVWTAWRGERDRSGARDLILESD